MKSRFEELEPIKEGYTNQVYLTERDTVLKKYSSFSAGSIFHFFRELVFSRKISTVSDRIENEEMVREVFEGEIRFPKIINQKDSWIEFELIEGESLNDILSDGLSNPYELGKTVGELMERFEDENIYLWDWALDDILITNKEVTMLDLEFAGKERTKLKGFLCDISLFSQAATLDEKRYRRFIQGIGETTEISKREEKIGLVASLAFNLLYFWEEGKPRKVLDKLV